MTSGSFSATRTSARLAELARLLDAVDPGPVLGDLLDVDAPHPGNSLLPGGAPLELSFSERSPSSLRLEVEPYGPDVSGEERLARAARAVHEIAAEAFGEAIAKRLDEQLSGWHDAEPLAFGAFVGVVFDASGLVELKLYREVGTATVLPPALAADATEVVSLLPGVRPHFASLAVTRAGIAERIYLVCEEGLRVLDLEALMRETGLAHRLPALADTIGAVAVRPLFVPERGALVAMRRRRGGKELKVELLGGAVPVSRAAALDGVRRALAERPVSLLAFDRFVAAVEAGQEAPAHVVVVSVRCDSEAGCDLNVYVRS